MKIFRLRRWRPQLSWWTILKSSAKKWTLAFGGYAREQSCDEKHDRKDSFKTSLRTSWSLKKWQKIKSCLRETNLKPAIKPVSTSLEMPIPHQKECFGNMFFILFDGRNPPPPRMHQNVLILRQNPVFGVLQDFLRQPVWSQLILHKCAELPPSLGPTIHLWTPTARVIPSLPPWNFLAPKKFMAWSRWISFLGPIFRGQNCCSLQGGAQTQITASRGAISVWIAHDFLDLAGIRGKKMPLFAIQWIAV